MTTLRWSRDQALSAPIAAEAGIPFRADQRQPEPILLPPYSSISVRTCPEVKSGHHPFLGLIDFTFRDSTLFAHRKHKNLIYKIIHVR